MKCYNHPEKDSVGVCKSCQRGICKDCSTLVGGVLACENICEEDVAALNYIVEQDRKEYKKLDSKKAPMRIASIICGGFFLGFGIFFFNKTVSWLSIVLGLIMVVCGVLDFIKDRKMTDRKDSA